MSRHIPYWWSLALNFKKNLSEFFYCKKIGRKGSRNMLKSQVRVTLDLGQCEVVRIYNLYFRAVLNLVFSLMRSVR